MYDIQNSYVAYCFDEAVIAFGSSVDNFLEEIIQNEKNAKSARAKAQFALEDLLKQDKESATPTQKFATPSATKRRKTTEE